MILHTTTEKILAAQLDVQQRQAAALERIAKRLEKLQVEPPPTEETVLREVESLPTDIPGRDALVKAGYTSVAQLPRSGKGLEKIKGIGRLTAGQILTYLITE
jgi:transposase